MRNENPTESFNLHGYYIIYRSSVSDNLVVVFIANKIAKIIKTASLEI